MKTTGYADFGTSLSEGVSTQPPLPIVAKLQCVELFCSGHGGVRQQIPRQNPASRVADCPLHRALSIVQPAFTAVSARSNGRLSTRRGEVRGRAVGPARLVAQARAGG